MLKLYNTLSRKKEIFKPKRGKRINLFVCGPTVYDFSHLGHARTYIVFDMIVKHLREKGFNIFYLQNITDIDDKIIKRAKEKKVSPQKLARYFEKIYFQDMKNLGINSLTRYAKATEHIKEIISQVQRLLKKGVAYQIEDGIYYDISKFKKYGKLSRRTVLQAEDAVSRIDESKRKKNKGDFCLWKLTPHRPAKAGGTRLEPSWPSPWGPGRPGWHIEDTAITEKYFGPQYDIHGGAKDLIFPHHEAEIAQMEAVSGKKPMVRYWLHSGFLTVKRQKMAKSLGNFITIRNFLKNHSPRTLRLFVLKNHYHSPIDYNEKEIEQIKKQLERIDEFIDKLQSRISTNSIRKYQPYGELSRTTARINIRAYSRALITAMDDDFNTPKALSSLFNLINKGNVLLAKNKLTSTDAKNILKFFKKIDKIFNFIFLKKPKKEKVPRKILKLVAQREKYRKQKKWKAADEIRRKVKDLGYQIEDIREGPKVKKL